MSNNILSISLPNKTWDLNKRRWSLPIESIKKDKTRLWISANEILPKEYVINNGYLELLNEKIIVNEATEVFVDLYLSSSASISPFGQSIVLSLIAIIPAVLTSLFTYYSIQHKEEKLFNDKTSSTILSGQSLVSYDHYPIVIDSIKNLKLDKENFIYNVLRFKDDILNPKAAADLIYLGQSNNIIEMFSDNEKKIYKNLIDKYKISDFDNFKEYHEQNFTAFSQIIDGIGKTFENSNLEFVLHDARDPMHSVVMIKNNMTNRFVGSPATNLGVHFIKYFSQTSEFSPPYLSYKLPYKERIFKASTIPIYDKKYGLIAFICVNLDVTDLTIKPSEQYKKEFINNMTRIDSTQKIEEVLKR
jgi:hypothetical protein